MRRSVSNISTFTGWNRITQLIETARGVYPDKPIWALIAFLMAGGFRISELIRSPTFYLDENHIPVHYGLRMNHISFARNRVSFTAVPLLKKYKKSNPVITTYTEAEVQSVSPSLRRLYTLDKEREVYIRKSFDTERTAAFRAFDIPINEPIVPVLRRYLRQFEDVHENFYLFSDLTRWDAYKYLVALDPLIWNHWFRAQRASQLAVEYHWKEDKIARWFSWVDLQTAMHYANMSPEELVFPTEVQRKW